MADYTLSKPGIGAVYPINCIEDTFGAVEPLITPPILKMRHLFGIPLVSGMVDPDTGKRQRMTDPIIEDVIERAVSMAELELRINIFPRKFREKAPFDMNLYNSFMFFTLPQRPVMSVDKVSVNPANMQDAYTMDPQWLETAYVRTGQINVVPITVTFQNAGFISPNAGGSGGTAFMQLLGQRGWIPAYWQIEYTSGFPEGQFPRVVNELIGVIAAIDILGILASTNAGNNGSSISMDGLSQSETTLGPQMYDARIQLLTGKKDEMVGKLKTVFGTKLFTGTL